MKLKKCKKCNKYTLKEKCPKCNEKTAEAHYKFIRTKKNSLKKITSKSSASQQARQK